ncbi:DUF1566 domain-containing protein [Hahella ganghwensis]|uniref:Lcl C-terminal domain-containing protein n=1 Tax=Hahella ganghwensis TaxID=286420 RepID=UPI00037066C1|nr:DUF1566 domain-containing protein [Hahella ganghwensis]
MSARLRKRILGSLAVGVILPICLVIAMVVRTGLPDRIDIRSAGELIEAQLSRWQKLDIQGRKVAPHQGPWACVRDMDQEVIWEVKSPQEILRHYKSSFSWLNPGQNGQMQGQSDLGSCMVADKIVPCDTEDLVRHLNRIKFCGASSWRLPTIDELKSLTDLGSSPGRPMINSYLFPRTVMGPYWSATTREKGGELVIRTYNFYQASEQTLPPYVVAWARLVSDLE